MGSCRSVGALYLQSLMWKVPTALFPYTPNDRYLLGMQWQGTYFVDMALPFGLRSAPYIFFSVADLAEWVLKKQYDRHLYPAISGLGDSPSPWQVGGPFHFPGRFRHRTHLSPIAGAPLARKIWSDPHTPGLLVTKTPLHTEVWSIFSQLFAERTIL